MQLPKEPSLHEFRCNPIQCAFSLIELLTVIAILALLSSISIRPVLTARTRARDTACLNNLKQLQLAWNSYADNQQDALIPNITRRINFDRANLPGSWVLGNAMLDSNTENIRAGRLYPYAPDPKVYRCPSDTSTVRDHPELLRTRSYSIDMWLNCTATTGTVMDEINSTPLNIRKFSRIHSPADVFVFIEQREDGLDDGVFEITSPWYAPLSPNIRNWVAYPADRHKNAATISFADGHADVHRWGFRRLGKHPSSGPVPSENDADFKDLEWLQKRLPQKP